MGNGKEQNTKSDNQPKAKYKEGGVEVTVWANNGTKGEFNNYTVSKSYKDKNGNWQRNANFASQNAKTLHKLLGQAIKENEND